MWTSIIIPHQPFYQLLVEFIRFKHIIQSTNSSCIILLKRSITLSLHHLMYKNTHLSFFKMSCRKTSPTHSRYPSGYTLSQIDTPPENTPGNPLHSCCNTSQNWTSASGQSPLLYTAWIRLSTFQQCQSGQSLRAFSGCILFFVPFFLLILTCCNETSFSAGRSGCSF